MNYQLVGGHSFKLLRIRTMVFNRFQFEEEKDTNGHLFRQARSLHKYGQSNYVSGNSTKEGN